MYLSEDEKDYSSDFKYEGYHDEYWDDDIKDITDEDVEHEKPNEVYQQYQQQLISCQLLFKCQAIGILPLS